MPIPALPDTTGEQLSYTKQQLCIDALRLVGRLAVGQAMTPQLQEDTYRKLDIVMASTQNRMNMPFTMFEDIFTVDSGSVFTYEDDTDNGRYRQQNIIYLEDAYSLCTETDSSDRWEPMKILNETNSREHLSFLDTKGKPRFITYFGNGIFKFYPTADKEYSIRVRAIGAVKEIAETGSLEKADVFGAPKRYYLFFQYALAVELGPIFGIPRGQLKDLQDAAQIHFTWLMQREIPAVDLSPMASAYPYRRRRR